MKKSIIYVIKWLGIRNLKQKLFLAGLGIGTCGLALMFIPFFIEILFKYNFFENDVFIKVGMVFTLTGFFLSSTFTSKKPMFRSKKLENLCTFIEKYI